MNTENRTMAATPRRGFLAAVVVLLMSAHPHAPTGSAQSLSAALPAKEYVYAGVKLLAVEAPFAVSITPATASIPPGAAQDYAVTVAAPASFNGEFTFAVTNLPPEITPTFNPATITGSGSTTLTLTSALNTPIATYPFTVMGTSEGITASAGATIAVETQLPVLIASGHVAIRGMTPSYSNGSVYAPYVYDFQLKVAAAIDPTAGFTILDEANGPEPGFNPMRYEDVAVQIVDGKLQFVTMKVQLDPALKYHVFNTQSNAWEITDELIDDSYGDENDCSVNNHCCSIAVRSDGSPVVHYQGKAQKIQGKSYRRSRYAVRENNTWLAGQLVEDIGKFQQFAWTASVDGADRVYFYYTNYTNSQLQFYVRGLDMDNTLLGTKFLANNLGFVWGKPMSYSIGGINRVTQLYGDIQQVLASYFDDDGDPSQEAVVVPQNISCSTTAVDGDTVYFAFCVTDSSNATSLMLTKSTNAGDWTVPVRVRENFLCCVNLHGAVFDRDGTKLTLTYSYADTSIEPWVAYLYYDEVELDAIQF